MRGLLATAACLLGLAVVLVVAARGETAGETQTSASGAVTPVELPRGEFVPVRLGVAFGSEAAAGAPTPELRRISLEIGDRVRFRGGLPSCPLADLYKEESPCPGSIVGHGAVASEIAPPGGEPTAVEGSLVAYFNQTHRQSRVLARVSTGEPLPVTYVIPFSVKPAVGAYGSELIVRRMSRIVGKCAASHPNCLAQPYTLKGVYGHISAFRMALDRSFRANGERRGFVEARCPAEPSRDQATLPLLRAVLAYADGSEKSPALPQLCMVDDRA
ncbi:MAG TPA: hypothetical protein VIT85_06660 [Solirubrobacterales bacterium]